MPYSRSLVLVLESTEPEKLAGFYARLLGAQVQIEPDLAHLSLVGPHGTQLMIRRNENMVPPVWPQAGVSLPAELRVQVAEADLDAAEREIIGLGGQPQDRAGADGPRTFADPDGHPFTLTPT